MRCKTISICLLFFLLLSVSAFAQVAITPSPTYSNNDLVCSIAGANPSAYLYKWYQNGQEKTFTGNTAPNSATTRSEVWNCKVYMPPIPYTGTTLIGEATTTIANAAPVVTITSFQNGIEGVTQINFAAIAVDPIDGDPITSWLWSFGNGITSTLQNPSYTYPANGTYTVTLTATDSGGAPGTASVQVVIADRSPIANFSASTYLAAINQTINFTDLSTSSPDSIISRFWNFGDGINATVQNATHAYSTNGTFQVNLSVTDSDGSTSLATRNITVNLLPPNLPPQITANYTIPSNLSLPINISTNVLFNITVVDPEGQNMTINWSVGGIVNRTDSNVINNSAIVFNYTFTQNGTYLVEARVFDNASAQAYMNWSVTVVVNQTDTSAPIISGVTNSSITNQSGVITWTTDDPANGTVQDGTTLALLASPVTNTSSITSRSITLAGLTNATIYFYNVTSCNQFNNCSTQGSFNFTTLQNIAPGTPSITLTSPATPQNITVNGSIVFNITAVDPEGSNLTINWSVNGTPAFSQVITNGSSSNFTQLFNQTGIFPVLVTVTDNQSLSANYIWNVNVTPIVVPAINITGNVIINEIMYDPDQADDSDLEWIELRNNDTFPINMSGWKINGVVLPSFVINASEYVILARELIDGADADNDSFERFYGSGSGVWGDSAVNESYKTFDVSILLINTGATIQLNDSTNFYLHSVTYTTAQGANGNNKTLERNATGFYESFVNGGTPGALNSNATPASNLPPQITANSTTPSITPFINISTNVLFNITVVDPEGQNMTINWSVAGVVNQTNNNVVNNSIVLFNYTFPSNGTYLVEARVFDNQSAQANISWNVFVVNQTDTSAPNITTVLSYNITNQSAIINWTTDDQTNGTVNYGTSLALGIQINDTLFATVHSIPLSVLANATTYYYNVSSCNNFANCSTAGTFNFTTAQNPASPVFNILNSTINNVYYPMNSSSQVPMVTINSLTLINNSVVNITTSITNSTILRSTVSSATVTRCTILDSIYTNANCLDEYVNPSIVTNSTTTGSTIQNSIINNSVATYSVIISSNLSSININNSNITNSVIAGSTLSNAVVTNANITNNIIYNGNITQGTTTYDATAFGPKNTSSITMNIPPTASIQSVPNVNITNGPQLVTLNASASTDGSDGGTLTYSWIPAALLTGATTATPIFNATIPGTYTFNLSIFDGINSSSAIVTFNVFNSSNIPPTANAGADQTVTVNTLVYLNASASSDPESVPLTFSWTQISGPQNVTLAGNITATPTFTPTISGGYIFRVAVSDNVFTVTDDIIITVNSPPSPPSGGGGGGSTVTTRTSEPPLPQELLIIAKTIKWDIEKDNPLTKTMRPIDSITFLYEGTSYSLLVEKFKEDGLVEFRISPTDEKRSGYKGDNFNFNIKDKMLVVTPEEINFDKKLEAQSTMKLRLFLTEKPKVQKQETVTVSVPEKAADGVITVMGELAPLEGASIPVGVGISAATGVVGLLLFLGIRKIWI